MCGRICDICGSSDSNIIHKGTRDNSKMDVYLCKKCGTRFLSIDTQGDYENGFMNGTIHMTEDDINKRLESCAMDDNRRAAYMKNICKEKKVLDFGCGFGGFLQQIKDVAKMSMGVELGNDERAYLKRNGINAVRNIDELNNKFDIITLFHVFEHLDNPVHWLRKIREVCEKDAKLFLEVPNANDALLSLYESKDFADFTYWSAHLYLYTINSLTKVIEDSKCWEIVVPGQVQRYPISNHLMWLAQGKPGGHQKWDFFNDKDLNKQYFKVLESMQMCDTLFFELKPR